MKTTTKRVVQLIVEQCVAKGMRHVVCSPGSRNAPLVIAFNQHPEVECIVIPDERCAAFYALGISQQTSRLVGVACTSGSASLNYYPAIAEAYYQQIPLIVFTADRPISWVNQGDGQTIVQHEVFKNHIRYSITLPEFAGGEEYEWYINRECSEALFKANGNIKGPVHFNLPFSEPLYSQEDLVRSPVNTIDVVESNSQFSEAQIIQIIDAWKKYPKKMILCGQMKPDLALENVLNQFVNDDSVVFLVENTANQVNNQFIQCIDRTLENISPQELSDFVPDLLITIGGAVVSKKIKSFLRNNKPKETWKVGYDFLFMDTYMSMNLTFPMLPFSFFKQVLGVKPSVQSNYRNRWKQKDYVAQDKAIDFIISQVEICDLTVFNILQDSIPENSELHLANSSVIRYAQLFNPIKSINTWCNRGTSGIDGSTSTAIGAAFANSNTWHTLITGDISFFYDSNAFWNKLKLPNLRIFLINNSGGGIFKIIPGPDTTEELNDFFVFNHQFSAEYICKAFNINYFKANSLNEIDEQLKTFYTYDESSNSALMEIFTPNNLNDKILKEYFRSLS